MESAVLIKEPVRDVRADGVVSVRALTGGSVALCNRDKS